MSLFQPAANTALNQSLAQYTQLAQNMATQLASGASPSSVAQNFVQSLQDMQSGVASALNQFGSSSAGGALAGFSLIADSGLKLAFGNTVGGALSNLFVGEVYKASGCEDLMKAMLSGRV